MARLAWYRGRSQAIATKLGGLTKNPGPRPLVASRRRATHHLVSDISDEESANYHRELLFYLLFILVFAGSANCARVPLIGIPMP
jgi:hypothetical protein